MLKQSKPYSVKRQKNRTVSVINSPAHNTEAQTEPALAPPSIAPAWLVGVHESAPGQMTGHLAVHEPLFSGENNGSSLGAVGLHDAFQFVAHASTAIMLDVVNLILTLPAREVEAGHGLGLAGLTAVGAFTQPDGHGHDRGIARETPGAHLKITPVILTVDEKVIVQKIATAGGRLQSLLEQLEEIGGETVPTGIDRLLQVVELAAGCVEALHHLFGGLSQRR